MERCAQGDSDNSVHRMENAAKLSPDVESLSAKHASTRELMEGSKSRSAAKDNERDDDEGPDLSLDNDNSRPLPGRREWSSKAEARQRSKEMREKKRKAVEKRQEKAEVKFLEPIRV